MLRGLAAMASRAEPLAALDATIAATRVGDTRLTTVPFLAQVGLRLDPDGPAAARLAAVLGSELPGPNRAVGAHRVLWLGPDEWLVVAADGQEDALVASLAAAVGEDGAVIDLSANRTGLELSGAFARDVLATCCTIDFHPRVFGPGQCVQTLIQKAGVLIDQRTDDTYLLLVRPSFAAYVAEWLLDGMLGLQADHATR
jgi:sarcosine oxidase subunit gamma